MQITKQWTINVNKTSIHILIIMIIFRLQGITNRFRGNAGQQLRRRRPHTSSPKAEEEVLRILHSAYYEVLGWLGKLFDGSKLD